jgi:ribose transport system substrate-binding protein
MVTAPPACWPRVSILEGVPGHETGDSRVRGFRDAIKGTLGITVVASQTANFEREQGFTVFQNMLEANPDLDLLFAASDLMALGAIEAIAAAGKTGKVRVIGFGGSAMRRPRWPRHEGTRR